jgi:hypothetical protein
VRILNTRIQTCLIVALVLFASGMSRRADACSPPRSGVRVSFASTVPQGGALLVETWCYYNCPDEVAFVVRDANGSPVPGGVGAQASYAGDSGWILWQPEVPFALGLYTIEYLNPESLLAYGEPQTTFEVTDGSVPTPVLRESEVTGHVEITGAQVCCAEGPINSCGGETCYAVPEKAKLVMSLYLGWDDGSVDAQGTDAVSQFLYRARAQGDSEWSAWSPRSYVALPFERASEYCYEVESWNVGTGDESVLFKDCFAEPADVVAPDPEAELAALKKERFTACTVPPAGYEAEWCENLAEERVQGDESCDLEGSPCSAAGKICPTLPLNGSGGADGSGGTSGSAGGRAGGGAQSVGGGAESAGGSGGSPDDGPGGGSKASGGSGDEEPMEQKVRGCSTAPGSPTRSTLGFLLGALGLSLLARRMRKVASAA